MFIMRYEMGNDGWVGVGGGVEESRKEIWKARRRTAAGCRLQEYGKLRDGPQDIMECMLPDAAEREGAGVGPSEAPPCHSVWETIQACRSYTPSSQCSPMARLPALTSCAKPPPPPPSPRLKWVGGVNQSVNQGVNQGVNSARHGAGKGGGVGGGWGSLFPQGSPGPPPVVSVS